MNEHRAPDAEKDALAEVRERAARWQERALHKLDEANTLAMALRTIRGPASDDDPFIEYYRAAGGGYEGLQAIARAALAQIDDTGGQGGTSHPDPAPPNLSGDRVKCPGCGKRTAVRVPVTPVPAFQYRCSECGWESDPTVFVGDRATLRSLGYDKRRT